jgi:uncharacterized protein involved in exopolysaccharide biosynthesis
MQLNRLDYMNDSEEAEISFHEVAEVMRKWRWRICALVVIVTAVTCLAAFILPKKYEAVVLLSPVTNSSTNGLLGGLNSVVSQFGGLAALAGLSQNTDPTKSESLAVLESEALTEQYIQRNNLLPILFRSKWDSQRNTWNETNPKKIPTLWKANQLFKKEIRTVSSDTKSGLVSLTISWTDANTAAKWANDLVRMTNDYRRGKAIEESERNIAYLTTEAGKTDVVGVKQAIYSILQTEISKMMLARGNEEYSLKVVDPAVPPEKPSSPRPILWTVLAFFISIGLSVGFAFLYSASTKPRTP